MVNGWVIVDKPEGITSANVVYKIKRLFKCKKVGHGGTLDPLATGVLPLALGEATKTISYVLNGDKSYRFEVKWGEATATDDREGDITQTSPLRPTRDQILSILPKFQGNIQQRPPEFSALKVNGKRAYTLARQGISVDLAPREVHIQKLTLLETTKDTATFEVDCSKGTYVRSLARDLALCLGTFGHITVLRRLKAGPFHEKDAILLDSLLNMGHNSKLEDFVLPLQDALGDILALEVRTSDAAKLRQGQAIATSFKSDNEVVLVTCEGTPLGLARLDEGMLKPQRIFNLN